jgi:aspartate-semialdehyde dehydrogenase
VGQRFILLLADHPFLELHAIGASQRSAGKAYKDAVRWKQATAMSERLSNLVLRDCTAEQFADCDLVFSGLNSDIAGEVGMWNASPTKRTITNKYPTRDGIH